MSKLMNILYDVRYFFRRKYQQIRNVIRWLPILWNQFDFDYSYAIEVFRFQLLHMSEFFDSTRTYCHGAELRAQRTRTIIKLMDKVYNDEYALEYAAEVEKEYGKSEIVWKECDLTDNDGQPLQMMTTVWERGYTEETLKKVNKGVDRIMIKYQDKQAKAHRILWKLIEHNIQGLWD